MSIHKTNFLQFCYIHNSTSWGEGRDAPSGLGRGPVDWRGADLGQRRRLSCGSRVSLLFHFYISSQDSRDFALHEGPRYIRPNQGALLPAGAVHLAGGPLGLDTLSRAREAEFVAGDGWALNEMRVLQAFVANGTAEGSAVGQRRIRNVLGVHLVHARVGAGRRRRHL